MGLHSSGVFGLRQDLQQLIIREEIETRECSSLSFEIVVEASLNPIQSILTVLESVEERPIVGEVDDLGILAYFGHHGLPVAVYVPEVSGFDREMLLDIR